ncbi:hypothetical protein VA249_46000 (plasmid) [Vibrio alfacsensis]|uniref:hypothetical protein n=1 Tax=Vibrio alfacsensis TaxID=1074311 RepID=UPI001BF11C90|nr:hypothetical protein [Vibrio alfacsensis]BBM67954.1 hypothetical protein VA249_46000 [Vibrio alfacsensis]
MFENIWIILVASGTCLSWFAAMRDSDSAIQASIAAFLLAVVFAWDAAILQLYTKVSLIVPIETSFHLSIVVLLTGLIVIAGCGALFFSPFLFMDNNANISIKNFLKIFGPFNSPKVEKLERELEFAYKQISSLKSDVEELEQIKHRLEIELGKQPKVSARVKIAESNWQANQHKNTLLKQCPNASNYESIDVNSGANSLLVGAAIGAVIASEDLTKASMDNDGQSND